MLAGKKRRVNGKRGRRRQVHAALRRWQGDKEGQGGHYVWREARDILYLPQFILFLYGFLVRLHTQSTTKKLRPTDTFMQTFRGLSPYSSFFSRSRPPVSLSPPNFLHVVRSLSPLRPSFGQFLSCLPAMSPPTTYSSDCPATLGPGRSQFLLPYLWPPARLESDIDSLLPAAFFLPSSSFSIPLTFNGPES